MIPANDNEPLRFFSVCSGIEAATVAWHPLGWQCVGVAEIEKFPSAVLAHHYPEVPNHGDFTKVATTTLGRVDILCGGTPCQAFSVAGLRQSLDDARGNLTLAFVDLAHELAGNGKTAGNGLRNVVWENVPGVLSTKDNAFGCFLAGLVGADDPLVPPDAVWGECTYFDLESYDVHRTYGWQSCTWANEGMVEGPRARAAWRILDAQYFGLAQRRRRVIVVADFGNGADPAAVLFERASLQGDTPTRREAGEGTAHATAPSLTASGRGVERTGESRGQDPVVAVLRGHSDYGDGMPSLRAKGGDCAGGSEVLIAKTLVSGGHSNNPLDENLIAIGITGRVSHALSAEGADASEDGTGRGTPIVAFTSINNGADATEDQTPTLTCGGGGGYGVGMAIAFGWQNSSSQGLSDSEHIAPTLDKSKTPAVTVALRGREGGATAELGGDVATALRASSGGGDKPHVLTSAVRRLTPEGMRASAGLQGRLHSDTLSRQARRGMPRRPAIQGARQ